MIESGKTVWECSESGINRMIVCSKCPDSHVDAGRARAAFRTGIKQVAARIGRFDEWGYVPERSKVRRASARAQFRVDHADQLREKAKDRSLNEQIERLRKQLGGTKP